MPQQNGFVPPRVTAPRASVRFAAGVHLTDETLCDIRAVVRSARRSGNGDTLLVACQHRAVGLGRRPRRHTHAKPVGA